MIKRFLVLLLISLTFTACAGKAVINPVDVQLRYAIIPESPRPGEPVTIGVNKSITEAILFVDEKQAAKASAFFVPGEDNQHGFTAVILTVPSTIEAESAIIRLNGLPDEAVEIPVTITPREFRSETLHLTPALTNLVTGTSPERTEQAQRLWEILGTTGDYIYHTGNFVLPVTSTRRTSQFGTRRINQYSDGRRVTSIHAGVDFGIPTGTEVYACGRGRVVLASFRIISGYSVIIEHAPGVYSIYYHLDSISAEEGAIVEAGELIGLSGSTGFSTGPHLHWELRVSSENTDPDAFVARPVLDKNLIISNIFN